MEFLLATSQLTTFLLFLVLIKDVTFVIYFFLANCYATFSDLCEAFKEVTGEPLTIGDSAVKNSSTALKLNMSESEDLKRYNEYHFIINRAWSNKVSLYYLVL